MRQFVLAALALLAACHDAAPSPEKSEDRAAAARKLSAYAKQANRGPMIAIEPQPILEQELEKLKYRSGGCVFSPGDGERGAMALAMTEAGYMKFDDRIVRFAADSGSPGLSQGARTRYVGATHLFHLQLGEEGRGRLTVEDPEHRVLYDQEGKVWCNSQPRPPRLRGWRSG